jgi:hypothetical protein
LASTGPIADVFARWPMLWQSFGNPNEYDRLVRELPADVVNLITAECLFGEVFNGGFDQYFSNFEGISIREATRGLKDMELEEYAEIASEALAVLGHKFVRDHSERWNRMYAETPGCYATNVFDDLDARFFELEAGDNDLSAIVETYAAEVLKRYSN